MSHTEEYPPTPPDHERANQDDQRLAIRRISQRLKRLQAELDRINQKRSAAPPD